MVKINVGGSIAKFIFLQKVNYTINNTRIIYPHLRLFILDDFVKIVVVYHEQAATTGMLCVN